jgi:hypothetical protein
MTVAQQAVHAARLRHHAAMLTGDIDETSFDIRLDGEWLAVRSCSTLA